MRPKRTEDWPSLAEFRDAVSSLAERAKQRGSNGEHPVFKSDSISFALNGWHDGKKNPEGAPRVGGMSSASVASAVPNDRTCAIPKCRALPTRFSPFESASARVCKRHFDFLWRLASQ